MKAIVTSIGEPTTELCVWALDRLGLDVDIYFDPETSLAEKLQMIYADQTEDFIRVDADVIPNKNVLRLPEYEKHAWWIQAQCYGWFAQDLIHGGVQFICKEALPALRANIGLHLKSERPETEMFRLPDFHNPRRCVSSELVCGVHGWGQTDDDFNRVKKVKFKRRQQNNYDWELVERMRDYEAN